MDNSLIPQIRRLGFNIESFDNTFSLSRCDRLVIPNTNLRDAILDKTENTYGKTVLKMSLSPEHYVRYKNGTLSSMVKGSGGISGHQGHEELCLANIVDNIFYEVSYYYTECVLREFHSFADQMLNSVAEMNNALQNTLFFQHHRDQINHLETIRDFLGEVFEDLADISSSKQRCDAYLRQMIDMRFNVMKVYNYLIQKMWDSVKNLSAKDFSGRYQNIYDPNSISNDYMLCRQAIGCYTICATLEHVLSGSIDERSTKKVVNKVESFLAKFNEVDKALKDCLFQRSYENGQWDWWRTFQENQYRNDESQHIQWFIEQCINNPSFEVQKIKALFSRSKNLLENIVIEPE